MKRVILVGMVGLFLALFVTAGGAAKLVPDEAQHTVSQLNEAVPLNRVKITFREISSGLSNPVWITHAGDGSRRMFVVERIGRVRIVKNGDLLAAPFLDIQLLVKSTFGEQGLLGLAFHPAYASNGKFYVVYTAPRPGDTNGSILTLRQYSVSPGNPDVADPNSGTPILEIDHPSYINHNGSSILFGADGYLYWSTGDGGGSGDPNQNAQNLTSRLGKILRLDVNAGQPYAIPTSNPFYGSSDPSLRQEIWAYGLRNPWRISFDRLTHDLYIGDVGERMWEEIDFQASTSAGGENYGWRIMEGSACFSPASGCDRTGKVLPVVEYDHGLGCSVTGGYVYRGLNFPILTGYYFYGDFCSGRLYGIAQDAQSGWSTPVQLMDTTFNITTFGEDEQGELYLADYGTGKIYQIQGREKSIYADFDGNGTTDVAVFRPTTGGWFVKDQFVLGYGTAGDVPVPGDYDGDGDSDAAVFRGGAWFVRDQFVLGYGTSGDIPVPGDYDGDGDTDMAVFRNGAWFVKDQFVQGYGTAGDIPVPADYDGDGDTDVAVFRNGAWFVKDQFVLGYGTAGDIPVPADYDGDGDTDVAVFRPSTGGWYVKDQFIVGWGTAGDFPIPGDYDGDGKSDLAVFRNGAWFIRDQFVVGYGVAGDIPLSGRDTNGDGDPYQ